MLHFCTLKIGGRKKMKYVYLVCAFLAFLLSIINFNGLFLVWFTIGILSLLVAFVEWLGEY